MLRSLMRAAGLVVSLAPALVAPVVAEDWSRFRGPNGAGVSLSRGLPVEFGPGKNLDWAADVPFGRSSPAFAGDRIFLTATEGGRLVTLALDRSSGKVLWRQALERSETAKLYHDNDSATPTPATDGSNVYVLFHEAGVVSYDDAGRERWRHPLGSFRNFYGVSASPVLAGDRLLVVCDQSLGSFVLALDKDTGKPLWRADRPARRESYATPVLYPTASTPRELLVYGSRPIDAYDVATGQVAWTLGGVSAAPVASPLLVDGLLFVAGADQQEDPLPPFAEVAQHDANRDSCLARSEVGGRGWSSTRLPRRRGAARDGRGVRCSTGAGDRRQASSRSSRARAGPARSVNYRKNVSHLLARRLHNVFYMVKDHVSPTAHWRLHKRRRLGGEDEGVRLAGAGAGCTSPASRASGFEGGKQWGPRVNDLTTIYPPAIVEGTCTSGRRESSYFRRAWRASTAGRLRARRQLLTVGRAAVSDVLRRR
jgi:outer membrane protein assembly factor BamB